MPLDPGTRLGPYSISAIIGAGGMGEVYKARDSRLDRAVAIKVLPARFAEQPEMRKRFEREARSISMLHHPNICSLFDMGEQDGISYLVMEYLEGEPLDRRLTRGPVPLPEALEIAIQIASALDQAHQKGLIHRDLKPGNVMLTSAGAKLLDFGLAKPAVAPSGAAVDVTVTNNLTMAGSIVGTLAYMSPERLEGNDGDARGDIFAAGAVIYEMLTGKRAFAGGNQASLITAVMSTEPPPVSDTFSLASPALDRVVHKCLAKQPDQRWQTARDLMSELQWIATGGTVERTAPPPAKARTWKRWAPWAVAGVSLTALSGMLLVNGLGGKPQGPSRARLEFPPPPNTQLLRIDIPTPSPDGRQIMFFGQSAGRKPLLWIRDLETGEIRSIPGVENGVLPLWAPDGRRIAYMGGDSKLWLVNLVTGSRSIITELGNNFGGGTWNQEDVIVFGDRGKLMRVAAAGGTPVPVPISKEIFAYWPIFLPDGKHLVFSGHSSNQSDPGSYLLPLSGGAPKRILDGAVKIVPGKPGSLLFNQGNNLFTRPFSTSKQDWDGPPTQLASGLFTFGPDTAGASFFSSWNGVVAYRTGATAIDRQMVWLNRAGQRMANIGDLGRFSNPALSPDGRWLAVGVEDPAVNTRDIWVYDLKRGTSTRVTSDPGDEFNPAWSPDGKRIAYSGGKKNGPREIYISDATGAGQPELVTSGPGQKNVEQWAPDGKHILINLDTTTDVDLALVSLDPAHKLIPLFPSKFRESMGRISPNGRWLAYRSNESGKDEIYVRAFDASGAPGRKWLVSTDGGSEPEWRRDGKELFYIRYQALMAIDVSTAGTEFDAGAPKPLFEKVLGEIRRNRYLAAPDGDRFLLVVPPEEQTSSAIQVLLDLQR